MSIGIHEKESGDRLAQGEIGAEVVKYEGNLYFQPAAVTAERLKVTDRTYTCPSKGTCNWVDYVGGDGRTVQNVGWVYPTTKAGHELIQGRYGFYAGNRGGTLQRDES